MTDWTANYFIGKQFLGASQIESWSQPQSIAYFCPKCGDIWARIICGPVWYAEHSPCEKHDRSGGRDWDKIPGCLLTKFRYTKAMLPIGDWGRAIEHLPEAVLKREFDLTLRNYDEQRAVDTTAA